MRINIDSIRQINIHAVMQKKDSKKRTQNRSRF